MSGRGFFPLASFLVEGVRKPAVCADLLEAGMVCKGRRNGFENGTGLWYRNEGFVKLAMCVEEKVEKAEEFSCRWDI